MASSAIALLTGMGVASASTDSPVASTSTTAPAEVKAPPADRVQTVKFRGQVIPVKTAGGAVSEEVRTHNADGSISLLIPKGFSASAVPIDLDESAKLINNAPAGNGIAVLSHDSHWSHTSAYSWGGLVNDPYRRDTWLFNRLEQAEEQFALDMVLEINYGLRPAMESEQGIPQSWSPAHAYIDDDVDDGNCNVGGTSFQGYSYSTICTSYNVSTQCGDGAALGCAWLQQPSVTHNGGNHQPSMFIKAGLPNDIERRNTTFHEIGHSLGWGHNQADSTSIMHSGPNSTSNKRITFHDTEDLSNKYRHAPDSG